MLQVHNLHLSLFSSIALKSLNDPRQKSCYFDPIFTEVAQLPPLFFENTKDRDITLEKTLLVYASFFDTSF
jgi:hypothetical protein